MASIDEFNIAQFQQIPAAINRIGAAKIAMAQDAFYRQQGLADEQRLRAARLADAEQMFNVQQKAREAAMDRDFRKKLEAEAASLGLDIKGSNEELLRQIKVKIKSEKDDDKRKEREESLSDLEETLYARADAEVFTTKEKVKIASDARSDRLEKARPVIAAFHKRWLDRKKDFDKDLKDLQKPTSPIEVAAHMSQNADVKAILSKLNSNQQLLFRGGNISQVIKATTGFFGGDSAETRVLNQAKIASEEALGAAKVQSYLFKLEEFKKRRFDEEQGLAGEFGMEALISPGKDGDDLTDDLSPEEKAGVPNPFQGPPPPAAVPSAQPSASLPPGYFRGVLPMAADYAMRAPSALMASPVGTELRNVGAAFAYPFQTAGTALMGGQFQAAPFGFNPALAIQPTPSPVASTVNPFLSPPPQLTIEQLRRGQQSVNPFQTR